MSFAVLPALLSSINADFLKAPASHPPSCCRKQPGQRSFPVPVAMEGLRRLINRGELRLEGSWWLLQDPPQREAWFAELTATDGRLLLGMEAGKQTQPPDDRDGSPGVVSRWNSRYAASASLWNSDQDRANSRRNWLMRPEVRRNLRAVFEVVSPLANVLAIRRWREGN